ncbi:hypothetical protein H2248_012588 [Termitomyces sp. 'cryptogamus']|nr:hypothetical protein H2248_012588 [Termitomyces sp. 'cryptogamus']
MLLPQTRDLCLGTETLHRGRGPSGPVEVPKGSSWRRHPCQAIDAIFEKIDRAFNAGEVTKDLLKSIAVLSALSDKSFVHIRSIISRDLGQAGDTTKYGPVEIRQFLEGEQTLLEADKSTSTPADTNPTMFAAKPFRGSNITCSTCKARKCPVQVYTGHTAPWCILEGGTMEGKTLEESKKARLAYYKNLKKDKKKTSKITFTPTGGNAFTLEGDSEMIATYLATQTAKTNNFSSKPEFAGLASDEIPSASAGSLADVEELEFDAWIVLEEELRAGLDWNKHTKHDPCHESVLSCKDQTADSFFIDSAATLHISPDVTDFITINPIHERPICGVGGSSIAAMGISTIRLCVAEGTYLELENALHVPKSTVHLLSVSKLAWQIGIATTFDDIGAALTNKSNGKLVATSTLILKRDLYALDLLSEHAFAVHASPNLKSWHLRLGHANYQTIMQMARAGMIQDQDTSTKGEGGGRGA